MKEEQEFVESKEDEDEKNDYIIHQDKSSDGLIGGH